MHALGVGAPMRSIAATVVGLTALSVTMCREYEPQAHLGFRVMLQAVQDGRMYGEKGGFDYRPVPGTLERHYFPDAAALLTFFETLPASVQRNGIWVRKGWDNVYSHGELDLVNELAARCRKQGIPLFVAGIDEMPQFHRLSAAPLVDPTPNYCVQLTAGRLAGASSMAALARRS